MFESMITSVVEAYGQFGLFAVMVIQTIIAPIPSEGVLIFVGAIGMSLVDIIIYGGLGLIVGSVIAFFVGRHGGKPIVKKILGEKWTSRVDGWVDNHGGKAILLTRLVPILPFDLISYISGVTSIKFSTYLLATALGAFPRCLVLAFLGAIAGNTLMMIGLGLDLIFIIGVCGLVLFAYLDRKGYFDALRKKITGMLTKPYSTPR